MSSQGSVHSPLIGSSVGTSVQTPVIQQTIPVMGSPLRPQSPVATLAPTVQSSVFAQPSAFATTVPVAATSRSGRAGSVSPTIPVEVPTLEDTKAAFQEVSSTFRDMSAQHGQIQGNLANTSKYCSGVKTGQARRATNVSSSAGDFTANCICG